jgi:hypothetical protein
MSAFPDLIHCPDPQCLKRLVIKPAAVVISHGIILPDHKIKVELLSNSLVTLISGGSRVSIASVATTQAAIQQVFDVLYERYPSTGRINRDSDCERTI